MTKRQLEAYRSLYARLERMGFDGDEVDKLCAIERTLHRWAERACNGEVETDDDGKAYSVWYGSEASGNGVVRRYRTVNREAGAIRRLTVIMRTHPEYVAYHQTDPRGCALYIVRKADIPKDTPVDSCYSTYGVAVCI